MIAVERRGYAGFGYENQLFLLPLWQGRYRLANAGESVRDQRFG